MNRSIHIRVIVPKHGDILVEATGDIPRPGFLGPFVVKLCANPPPVGIYEIDVEGQGDALSANLESAATRLAS